MTATLQGIRSWSTVRDKDGHREYTIKFKVRTDDVSDGPGTVLLTPGLPLPGSYWVYGNDVDTWATCRWDAKVTIHQEKEGEPNKDWIVEQVFSTRPIESKSCRDQQFQDPLLEPQKVSGSSRAKSEETVVDRFGLPITSSSWEFLKGQNVSFDSGEPTVTVEQNVSTLQLDVLARMAYTVNDRTLWGLPRRTILLTDPTWERKYHGNCNVYYTRKFTFAINYNTWDRDLLDEGTKVLNGKWNRTTGAWQLVNIAGAAPDPYNPQHFIRFIDRLGNPAKAVLNGRGLPAGVIVATSNGGLGTNEYYISIVDSNTGNPLNSSAHWIPLASDPTEFPADFDGSSAYPRGTLIFYDGGTYVAVEVVTSQLPGTGTDWVLLNTDGVIPISSGTYDAATTYSKYNWVTDPSMSTRAGYIHVEKYAESNFLLLGIPLTF